MFYRPLFRTAPRGLVPVSLPARLPYAMSAVAVVVAVHAATGSLALAGAAAAALSVSLGVGGPVAGILADRFGGRCVAAAGSVLSAAATLGLLVTLRHGELLMVGAAAAVGLTQPPVGVLLRTHWATSLRRSGRAHLLPTALAWEATGDEVSFIVGPALVGGLALLHPSAGLFAVAGLLLCAGVPLSRTLVDDPRFHEGHGGQAGPQSDAGLAHPAEQTDIRVLPRVTTAVLTAAMACIGLVFGAIQTGLAGTGSPSGVGLTYALLGVGSAVAGALYPWVAQRVGLRSRYRAASVALFAATVILVVAAAGWCPVPLAMVVAGIGISPYLIALYAVVERVMPPARLTTGLAVVGAGSALGAAGGQFAGGLLGGRSPVAPFLVAASAGLVAVIIAWLLTGASARNRMGSAGRVRATREGPSA